MMDPHDLERTREIVRHAETGRASAADKRELREILARYSERAWDVPWDSLLDAADYALALGPDQASAPETA